MTGLIRNPFVRCLAVSLALATNAASAQTEDAQLRLPMSFEAESTRVDGKTSTMIFRGLRLSQGSVAIRADEGRAKRMELEDSTWQFAGNVAIDVDNGHIKSDSADLQFDEFELKVATVTGSPATFELTRAGSDDVTYAEAGQLSYDVEKGIIEFSGDATITEGGNRISSNFLVYNIVEQTIDADSSGTEDDRVRITYTPNNGDEAANGSPETEEQNENP